MITTVDTNILLDVFMGDECHGQRSRDLLRDAYDNGTLLVCSIVYAELVPAFNDQSALDRSLQEIRVTLSPIDTSIAYETGVRWKRYRDTGGPRERIMSDFLIGAHAMITSDAFLTRDRGFYATYFPELQQF